MFIATLLSAVDLIMQTKLILGPPGTGKTTRLLTILDEELSADLRPSDIAFVSFTRKGAYEARDRVVEQFGYTPDDLPYFRTLHSIAFQATRVRSDQVLQKEHYQELSDLTGFPFRGFIREDDPYSSPKGDTLLFLIGYAKNKAYSLEEAWREVGREISIHDLIYLNDSLEEYKNTYRLIDFNDMIGNFIEQDKSLPVKVAFVDEAQDLSQLQWQMVYCAFRDVDRLYIAGDDDQAIYQWSGADINEFLSLEGEREILNQSHRIPASVFMVSNKIVQNIKTRYAKEFKPKEERGSVRILPYLDLVKFNRDSWLLLARNRYMLREYENQVREQGFAYTTKKGSSINVDDKIAIYAYERLRRGQSILPEDAELLAKQIRKRHPLPQNPMIIPRDFEVNSDTPWFDALDKMSGEKRAYYQAVLRQGGRGSLANEPNIHIDTIHGVKGGEADNVVLISDMSARTYEGMIEDPDPEHRVFYVGATRAKKNLIIIRPQTEMYYRF